MKQLLFLLLVCSMSLSAQITVTGTVMDGIYGGPLPGATVRVKNKTIGTQTDFDGKFTLVCDSVDVIEVSCLAHDYTHKTVIDYGTTSFKAYNKRDTITLEGNKKAWRNRKIQDSLLHSPAYINRDSISSNLDYLQLIVRDGHNTSWVRIKRFTLILYDKRLHKKGFGVIMFNSLNGNKSVEKKFGYFSKDSLNSICTLLNKNMAFNHKYDILEDYNYVPVLCYDDMGVYVRAKSEKKQLENDFSVWSSHFGFGTTVLGGLLRFGENNSQSNTDSLYQDFVLKNKKLIESDSVLQRMIQLYEEK